MSVVVIGGGVIGYSVACALAWGGADVHVIDMRGPGRGATQASAGMLAPYIEGHGEVLLRLGVHSLSLYDDFITRLESAAGVQVEYSRSGTLQVARSSRHADELSRAAAQLAARGVEHSTLTGREVGRLEPALAADSLSGLLVPAHGYVHVGQLMSALVSAAGRAGVRAVVDRVIAVEAATPGLRVVGERQAIDASVAVIAAGSWSGALAIGESPRVPVRPIRGQLVELEYPAPSISRVVWGEDCYVVPWKDGSVIVGATVEDVGFDESSTPDAVASLVASGSTVLPSCASARVRAVRVGLRPASSDELPILGWSSTEQGVCLATGHYRNGILLAPLTARLVADLVLGRNRPEDRWALDALAPSRFGL